MKRPLALPVVLWLLPAVAAAAELALPQEIERLLGTTTASRNGSWGIQIVELSTGRAIYSLNAQKLFVPASNAKLFTLALALSRLGPDFRFETRVTAEQPPDADGRIAGAVRLVGGGDPNLSGRELPYRMGAAKGVALAAIQDLANQIAAAGVKRIEGGIVGDDSWYVWQPYPEGWAVDDPLSDFGAPVSALSVNDNTIALAIRPGAKAGDLAAVSFDPPVEFYRVDNRLRTRPPGAERDIHIERDPGERQIRVWGTIPLRDRGETELLAVEDPALFAAWALREALEEKGVAVAGGLSARHLYAGEAARGSGPLAAGGVQFARRESAPLAQDLQVTAKISQNLHAEMALRAVGRARTGVGSLEAGLAEMKTFLGELGIDSGSYDLRDGSGLSRLNLVSPVALIQLLQAMYGSPLREQWISLLPVGGTDGTLSERFAGAAGPKILAKTGTMSHVSALSGYAQRSDGEWLAFSILVNNYAGPASDVRGIMDRICRLLVE